MILRSPVRRPDVPLPRQTVHGLHPDPEPPAPLEDGLAAGFGTLEKPFERLASCRGHRQTRPMRYAFADCELDITRHRLLRTGQEVHVEPQVFTLIACLAAARGALVSYDTLIEIYTQERRS